MDYFLAVDFDGTIANVDVTDAVLEQFANPEWLMVEALWAKGRIGSQECLRRQLALVEAPLTELLDFVAEIPIDPSFISFVRFVQARHTPIAIISDGFQVFIDRILDKNGLQGLPVYANTLTEEGGRLMTAYPHASRQCPAGTCKCHTARGLSQGLPVYLVGDGQSDFCLAQQADFVYAKAKLIDFCQQENIDYCAYSSFDQIMEDLQFKQIKQSGIA